MYERKKLTRAWAVELNAWAAGRLCAALGVASFEFLQPWAMHWCRRHVLLTQISNHTIDIERILILILILIQILLSFQWRSLAHSFRESSSALTSKWQHIRASSAMLHCLATLSLLLLTTSGRRQSMLTFRALRVRTHLAALVLMCVSGAEFQGQLQSHSGSKRAGVGESCIGQCACAIVAGAEAADGP